MDAVKEAFHDDRNTGDPDSISGGIGLTAFVFFKHGDCFGELVRGISDILGREGLLVLQGVVGSGSGSDRVDGSSDGGHIHRAFFIGEIVKSDKGINDIDGIAVLAGSFLIGRCTDAEEVPAVAKEAVVGPVCGGGTDADHGDPVDEEHDHGKDGKTQPAVGHDLVDLIGGRQLADLVLLIAVLDQLFDIGISLVGDDALGVVIQLCLGRDNVLFHMGQGLLVDLEDLENLIVSLEDLDRVPALLLLGHVMDDGFLDMGDRVLDGPREGVLGDCLVHCSRLDCHLGSLRDTGSLQSGDLGHSAAQLLGELLKINMVAVFPDQVTHVDRHDDGDAQLDQLCGQIEVSLKVGAVDDIEDGIRPLLDQVISGNDLLQCVRREGIDARKVRDDHFVVPFELTFLFFDCDTGPVSDKLVGAGQCVEQCSLAAVRVTGKRNPYSHLYLCPFYIKYC